MIPHLCPLTEKRKHPTILGCKSGCYPCNLLTISLVLWRELGFETQETNTSGSTDFESVALIDHSGTSYCVKANQQF